MQLPHEVSGKYSKNIEVIWKNVFIHARVMVIGVSSDLKKLPSELHYIYVSQTAQLGRRFGR